MISNQNENSPMCPKTWLVESILTTIFCCLPLGIMGIVYSSSVESRYINGDYEGARKKSAKANEMVILSFVFGIIWYFIMLIILIG